MPRPDPNAMTGPDPFRIDSSSRVWTVVMFPLSNRREGRQVLDVTNRGQTYGNTLAGTYRKAFADALVWIEEGDTSAT